ncbi:MAG: 1,6-anhydro-N-acetylmuramyl-L-alanine amidase AmpD [Rhodoferax sp.]|nr:1,6-anhydro-N-acetylmuramyl-L-alanine amidase AmpD [Rhodoferax sp.]
MTSPTEVSPVASLWTGGWWHAARPCPSPNFGARPAQAPIDLVLVHSISLPPGEYGGPHVQQLFTNGLDWDAHPYFQSIRGLQVSSHFFVCRKGVLWQFVSCDDRAWHAGLSHYRGRSNCNDDSIGIELEGTDTDAFTDAQYACLRQLCEALAQRYPIRYIAGHEHVAPGRKRDPGPGFSWSRLHASLSTLGWLFPADHAQEAGSSPTGSA